MVADVMWADASLKDFDIRLWCVLNFYARGRDHCEPTDASIAATMGVSVATVKRGLLRLEAAAFIERRHDSDGNRSISLTTKDSDTTPQVFKLRVAHK
jgi:transcription initiation factor IIE alpha subunit